MNDLYITYFQILYKPFKSNGKLSYEQYENTNVSPEINSKTQFSYFEYENDVGLLRILTSSYVFHR